MSIGKIPARQLFSERLKSVRESRGMKSADMAKFLGLSAPVYSRYENGRTPDTNTVTVIAEKLGKTIGWLIGVEPGIVLNKMDAGSESQYMEETEHQGKTITAWHANEVRKRMDAMRQVPPDHHGKIRTDINQCLDKYQTWCVDNHPSELEMAAYKARKKTARGESVEPGKKVE